MSDLLIWTWEDKILYLEPYQRFNLQRYFDHIEIIVNSFQVKARPNFNHGSSHMILLLSSSESVSSHVEISCFHHERSISLYSNSLKFIKWIPISADLKFGDLFFCCHLSSLILKPPPSPSPQQTAFCSRFSSVAPNSLIFSDSVTVMTYVPVEWKSRAKCSLILLQYK